MATVNNPVISSTLLLTLLMLVGLIFFIRASVKDRTEQVQLVTEESEEVLLKRLQDYFDQRAYKVTAVDPGQNQVIFQGFVRPSWFLAIFLSFLAAVGLLCLCLVLSMLYPAIGNLFLFLTLLAPLAGVFYWQKAGRIEQVRLKLETVNSSGETNQKLLTLTAHRDELIQFQQTLLLQPFRA